MELRPYQRDCLGAIMASFKAGNNFTIAQLPCGAGKTVIFSSLIKECIADHGIKALVLAHRGKLIEQAKDKLLTVAPELESIVGVWSAGVQAKKEQKQITIATRQSLRPGQLAAYNLVIIDESHRLPAKDTESQYASLLNRLVELNPRVRVLAVTATPYRLGHGVIYGDDPKNWFQSLCYQRGTQQMIDDGFLCKFRYKVTVGATNRQLKCDLSGVKKTGGEYNAKDLGEEMQKEYHLESALKAVNEHATDRSKVVIFCCTIEHSEKMAELFDGVAVHSKLPAAEREGRLESFESGAVRVMTNVDVLTEGWDCTGVDCVVLARPTMSPALYAQMCGRGLRLHDGKENCLFLDMAGNYDRHDLFTDPNIKKKKPKEQKASEEAARQAICPDCGEYIDSNIDTCPHCGFNMAEARDVIYNAERQKMIEVEEKKAVELRAVKAEKYVAKSGSICVKLTFSTGLGDLLKFYKLGGQWTMTSLKKIAQKHYESNCWNEEDFIHLVNAKECKTKTVKIKKDGNYKKVVGW